MCGAVPAGMETLWCVRITTLILTDGSCPSWRRCWSNKTQRSVDSFKLLHMQNRAKPNHTYTTTDAVVAFLGVTFSQDVWWTPSKMIHRLGREIDNPESICYWAYKVRKREHLRMLPHHRVNVMQPRIKLNLKVKSWPLFQNNIPVFSPALTDGALGDMFYLFSAENPGLILDIIEGKKESLALFFSNYLRVTA